MEGTAPDLDGADADERRDPGQPARRSVLGEPGDALVRGTACRDRRGIAATADRPDGRARARSRSTTRPGVRARPGRVRSRHARGASGAVRMVNGRPTASELLGTRGALLHRGHLRELGLGRSAIDSVFRALDVVVFPGSSRPYIRRDDYLALLDASTYNDNRVRLRPASRRTLPGLRSQSAPADPRERAPPGLDRHR
jgi:hypothetical protein